MRTFFFTVIAAFTLMQVQAQKLPVYAQNTYQSASNPYYWKNRKPHGSYWQQDVHYRIQATLNDQTDIVSGSEELSYWNNSPDTLTELYFHLYQNAFQPESHMHEMNKAGKISTQFGKYEGAGLGTVVKELRVNGTLAKTQLFNTILKVELSTPLAPGNKIEISMDFNTHFDRGSMRRRMKLFEHGNVKHYDGVHWYPRISVYDQKFGWTTDQHLGKEFYGDYGTWDVELRLPSHYILEATGVLTNEAEAMPAELRKKLDISNFKTPGTYTEIIKPDGTYKSWKFHAENVHDFAFTADPSYRIGEVVWNGIRCIALAQEPNAHGWQPTAQYLADIVRIYSEDIGMYAYPKMVAADARDGMEYPMITLNSGNWPGHQFVIAHEVGHNWFFGMLGNNETYRASMDEGFTQFLTAWSLKKISKNMQRPNSLEDRVVYRGYINHAWQENSARLNLHSDHFNSAERHGGGYGQVYYKTATMLYNLEYVLGEELFLKAMQHYFNQWKICHPYWEDFRNSITDYTGRDLNWFFDQWIESTDIIDYRVNRPKHLSSKDSSHTYELRFKRKGSMEMPLDVQVTLRNGQTLQYHIPNTLQSKKDSGVIELLQWTGWDMLRPEYRGSITVNDRIKDVRIDPSGRLADVYRLDNSVRFPWQNRLTLVEGPYSDLQRYQSTLSPDVFYNAIDGIKTGIWFRGNYLGVKHIIDLSAWYNTGLQFSKANTEEVRDRALFNYRMQYSNRIGKLSDIQFDSRLLDGLNLHEASWMKSWKNNNVRLSYRAMARLRDADLNYLHNPSFWQAGKWNNSFNLNYRRNYRYFKGNGTIQLDMRNTALFSDYQYAWIKGEVINRNQIHPKLSWSTRVYAALITGDLIAPESRLYMAGASPEDVMGQKYLRSRGWFPDAWAAYGNTAGHIHQGGGLNLRAYSAYRASNTNTDGDTLSVFSGNSGAAFNTELDFSQFLPAALRNTGKSIWFQTYAFADAGILGLTGGNSGIRADAGLGIVTSVKMPGIRGARPLQIRSDFPFFVNRLAPSENDYLAFRWILGINRAF